MTTPYGTRELWRPHTAASSPLRAWSAADQLVLDHLGTDELGRMLIVNDEFGAVACGLSSHEPTVWSDSALSRQALADNLARNSLEPLPASHQVAGHKLPQGRFDTVVIQVPKTTAMLDHQLAAIAAGTTTASRIVGAGMARHIHRSTTDAFERLIGPTTTSRATRKARLIHAERADTPSDYSSPDPTEFTTDRGVRVAQLPGTFSADHVDVGSALLIEVLAALPAVPSGATVADVGCGNGVLAASLAPSWTQAKFVLLDASDMAIAAAQTTWRWNDLGDRATFAAVDGFTETADASIDVVITNPPFHQGHALDEGLTNRLLADCSRVLTPKGVAYVVAQRHLNLHTKMKKWFASVEVVSKHPSHVVLAAEQPRR